MTFNNEGTNSFSIASLLSRDKVPRRKNPAPVRVTLDHTTLDDVQKRYTDEIRDLDRADSFHRSSLSPTDRTSPCVDIALSGSSTPDSARSLSMDERCNSVESHRSSGSPSGHDFYTRNLHYRIDKSPNRLSPVSHKADNISPRTLDGHSSVVHTSTSSGFIPRMGPLNFPHHHFSPRASNGGALPVPVHVSPGSFPVCAAGMYLGGVSSHSAMSGVQPLDSHMAPYHYSAIDHMTSGNPFLSHTSDHVSSRPI